MAADTSFTLAPEHAETTHNMDTSQLSLEPSQEEKEELLEDLPVHVLGDTKEELGISEADMAERDDVTMTSAIKVNYSACTRDVIPCHVCR